jgi:hypothetical protein
MPVCVRVPAAVLPAWQYAVALRRIRDEVRIGLAPVGSGAAWRASTVALRASTAMT